MNKYLSSILLFSGLMFSLEAHKHDKKPLPPGEYNINLVLSHDWVNFDESKPNYDQFVLLLLDEIPKDVEYCMVVGKLVKREGQDRIHVVPNWIINPGDVKAWMILPNLPRH